MLLAGIRRWHVHANVAVTIRAQWAEFRTQGLLAGRTGITAYGAICGHQPGQFEYLSGIEVPDFDSLPTGTGRMRVPAQRYAVFLHTDHVRTVRTTWEAIFHDWLPKSGMQSANTPEFERFDANFDPATGLGGFEIWVPIGMSET